MVTKGRIFNFEIFWEANAKDQTPIGAGASTPETGHHRSTALIAPDYAYAQAKIDQARHWDDQGGGKTEARPSKPSCNVSVENTPDEYNLSHGTGSHA